ncbi:10279_t:CDS:2 [Funneliformis geosporum]|uniref:10279_t:CDS:1 n=1 Tax=Funneliformis geosporum TaxID=1117311 RepID=A0A9W4S951_9GLOM|nr:10279_t:CDS:2 [Funneliformis geosporum]
MDEVDLICVYKDFTIVSLVHTGSAYFVYLEKCPISLMKRPRVPLEQPSFYSNSLSITARSSNSSLSKDLEDNHLECTVREVEVNDLRP